MYYQILTTKIERNAFDQFLNKETEVQVQFTRSFSVTSLHWRNLKTPTFCQCRLDRKCFENEAFCKR